MAIVAGSAVSAHKYTTQDLYTHAQNLLAEIKKIRSLQSFDSKAATEEARILSKIAQEFKDFVCTLGREQSLEELLKGKEIPIPFAQKMVEVLGLSEIQGCDELKRELSKTTLIVLEFFVFQCSLDCDSQGRRIYKEDVDKMRSTFRRVVGTLPESEVETRFLIRCAEASVRKLDVGIGKWKEVAKAHGVDVIKGVITALLTAPAFGANTAAPLVSPLIDLSIAIYRNLEEGWHRDVWALRWFCAGKRITTKAQLEAAKPLMKGFKNTNRDTYYLSFCISQIFMEVYQNPAVTDDLRKAIFEEEEMSLVNLAKLYDNEQLGDDGFWKTRYITITYLAEIAQDMKKGNEGYRKASIKAVILRWINEQAQVKVLAGSIIADLAISNTEEWAAPLRSLQDLAREQKITLENRSKRWLVSRSDVKKRIEHVETQIETARRILPTAPAVVSNPKGGKEQSAHSGQPATKAQLEKGIEEALALKASLEEEELEFQKEEIRAQQNIQSLDLIFEDKPNWQLFRV